MDKYGDRKERFAKLAIEDVYNLDKIKNPPAKITSGFTKHYIKDKLPLFSLFNLLCLKIYAYYLHGQIQKGT